jgi:hypothetical protein
LHTQNGPYLVQLPCCEPGAQRPGPGQGPPHRPCLQDWTSADCTRLPRPERPLSPPRGASRAEMQGPPPALQAVTGSRDRRATPGRASPRRHHHLQLLRVGKALQAGSREVRHHRRGTSKRGHGLACLHTVAAQFISAQYPLVRFHGVTCWCLRSEAGAQTDASVWLPRSFVTAGPSLEGSMNTFLRSSTRNLDRVCARGCAVCIGIAWGVWDRRQLVVSVQRYECLDKVQSEGGPDKHPVREWNAVIGIIVTTPCLIYWVFSSEHTATTNSVRCDNQSNLETADA